jgi:hypothetical protein
MPKPARPDHDLAGIPRWVSLLGVTATVRPAPEGSGQPSLMVLTTMAGAVVYPLDDQADVQARPAGEVPAGQPRRQKARRTIRPGAAAHAAPLSRRPENPAARAVQLSHVVR